MNDELVVGIDVGSQGTCAQALSPDGALRATSYVPHSIAYPEPGWAEQQPSEWLDAIARALLEVCDAVRGSRILAIAFGSQLDGLVASTDDGSPVGPALIWMDRRAGAECARVGSVLGRERLRELTGCNLDPGHVAAKIAWLRGHRGEAFAGARWFLLPGSFVAWRCSGRLAVDPSNASSTMLLDVAALDWSQEACQAFGVDPSQLAPILPAHSVLGPVAPWLREATGLSEDTLVVLGCGDEMAATLGAGVVEPGVACDVIGTAEPVCAVVSEPALDPDAVTELHPHASDGDWLLENPGWLSGGALRWFRDELCPGDGYGALTSEALEVPAGSHGVVWIPALAGAMAPEWNANARAAWFGLTASHGRAHLIRAMLEGNAFALKDVLGAMGRAGLDVSELVCVGGGARSDLMLQIRADVTGLPATRPDDVETTARGAAMLAAVGAGFFHDARAAAAAMRGARSEWVRPASERCEIYEAAYGRYRALYAALRPLF